jgi:glycosyl transferase family 25
LLADTSWIPADSDVVKLETFFAKTMVQRRRISVGHGFSMFRLRKNHAGTGGYLLSRQTARDFLEATEGLNVAVDELIFHPALPTSANKTIYQLVPALCAQDQFVRSRLPSLLDQERIAAWVASGLAVKRRRPVAERIRTETGRVVEWIIDFCRLRRYIIIPLDPPGAEE